MFTVVGQGAGMFRTTLLLATLSIVSPLSAEPSVGRAEMPLTEWRQTLERLRLSEDALEKTKVPNKAPAPIPGIIHTTHCEVTKDAATGQIAVEYDVESLADGWSIIPLTDDALPLETAQTSGGRLIHQEGRYALLTDGPLRAKVKLAFAFPDAETSLLLPDTLAARIGLTSPNPKTRLQAGSLILSAGKQIALPTRERKLSLRLLSETEAEPQKALILPPEIPGKWQTHPETIVHYEDGRLNFSSRVVLWCVEGDERLALLDLPPQTMLISVSSEDLLEWKIATPNQLRLEWKTTGKRQRVVEVQYAAEQKDLLTPWPLPTLHSADEGGKSGVWSVRSLPGLRFALPPDRPLPATLSAWMRKTLGEDHDSVFAAPAGFLLPVAVVKTVALPDAGIASAKYATRLSRGGGVLTSALIEVAHTGPVGAEFQLPKEARLVSCKIKGASQSPVDLGDGRFRLDLPATSGTIPVELSFAQQGPPLAPANGKIHLALLSSSLMTDQLEWTVQLPDDLSLNTFEGSVTAIGGGNGLRFRQELTRETAPWVDLFYQKKLK